MKHARAELNTKNTVPFAKGKFLPMKSLKDTKHIRA
jgi:hypothetical protein